MKSDQALSNILSLIFSRISFGCYQRLTSSRPRLFFTVLSRFQENAPEVHQSKIMSSTFLVLLLSFISFCNGIEICPTREISATSGRVTSPGYPSKYASNVDCILTIKASLDTTFTFTFTSIDMEDNDDGGATCFDSLTITGANETEGKEFCGQTTPQPYSPNLNVITLTFKTDSSEQRVGFDLSFTSVQRTGLPTPVNVCPTRQVTASLTGGRIMSPAFPNNYDNDVNCKLTLKIPPYKKTEITFDAFGVEYDSDCLKDKLLLSDINGKQGQLCGGGRLPSNQVFSGTEVYAHFTTNGNTNDFGFLMSYKLVDVPKPSCSCPNGNQYIKRTLARNNIIKRVSDEISVEFKTTEPNGLILYAKGSVRDFIQLKLENGNIVFDVDLGTGKLSVPVATGNLNDNAWHSVRVVRQGRSVSVTVNNGLSQASGTTPGSFTMLDIKGQNAALYVLGGPQSIPFSHNFKGCVRNLIIDDMKPIEALNNKEATYALYGLSTLSDSGCNNSS